MLLNMIVVFSPNSEILYCMESYCSGPVVRKCVTMHNIQGNVRGGGMGDVYHFFL